MPRNANPNSPLPEEISMPRPDLAKLLMTPCRDDDALHAWVKLFAGLDVPRQSVCPDHAPPFDYLRRSYFEPASDQVVWAPRGGGKTRLAAAATLLDLLHKPGTQARILGGSLEQSMKMWDYLLPDLHRLAAKRLTKTHGPAGPAHERLGRGGPDPESAGGPRDAGAEAAVRRGRAVRPGRLGGGAAHDPLHAPRRRQRRSAYRPTTRPAG